MKNRCLTRALVLLGILTLTIVDLRATAQAPDLIVFEAKEYPLLVNPLEQYFSQNPTRRPSTDVLSTANWRGYVAHFAIVGRELVVSDLRVASGASGDRSALSEAFSGNARVVATWFTGNLIIPDGKQTSYVHMGYGSEYERMY